MSEPSSDLDVFRAVLASAKCLGILTGAGLSAASGIQTYRGANGQWNTTDPFAVASLAAFQENPGRVWKHFHPRRDQCLQATPNAAHEALASLYDPETRRVVLPSLSDPDKPPLYITQNFDGLSQRSVENILSKLDLEPEDKAAAHARLIEMHGSCYKTICTQCKAVRKTDETPLAEIFSPSSLAQLSEDETIPVEKLPRCGGANWSGSNRYGRCGGLLRPAVIWFGEIPPEQGEIIRNLTKVDVLLVIGTSSLVHPAASYAGTVKKNGGTVAVFNLGPSKGDEQADFAFYGPCEESVPKVLSFRTTSSSRV